jgi:hypothetical protein
VEDLVRKRNLDLAQKLHPLLVVRLHLLEQARRKAQPQEERERSLLCRMQYC